MPGLDPGICCGLGDHGLDRRVKPGDDGVEQLELNGDGPVEPGDDAVGAAGTTATGKMKEDG